MSSPDSQRQICVWVLASGPAPDLEETLRHAPAPDYVIAADGGTLLARRLGLVPDLIIGDVDSSPEELVSEYARGGAQVRRFDHETKWETDTELALLAALDYAPGVVCILGALGGRVDHALANILLLTNPLFLDRDVRIYDGRHEIFLARVGVWNSVPGGKGSTVSLLPIGGEVQGVRTMGLHWPLQGESLPQGRGRGVSNLIDDAGSAAVTHKRGLLLVAVVHAP